MTIFTIAMIAIVLLIVALLALAMRSSYDKGSYTLLGLMGGFAIAYIVGIAIF